MCDSVRLLFYFFSSSEEEKKKSRSGSPRRSGGLCGLLRWRDAGRRRRRVGASRHPAARVFRAVPGSCQANLTFSGGLDSTMGYYYLGKNFSIFAPT
jgi:hypothetical protein